MLSDTAHAAHAAAAVLAAPVSAADGFLPHGYCYSWNKPLLLTHVASDLLIGGAYVVISVALAVLVHRARRDIPFSVLFVAFGLFIVACGMTHFMEVWTLWQPVYWLSGMVKVVTAVASVTTAAVLPAMVPRVHATVRDARSAREREVNAARAAALEEQNAALARERAAAEALAADLGRANAALRATAAALEERTAAAEAASAEAEAARQAAETANRAKADFLAVMSHELRTPLNAIGGYAELLALGIRGPVSEAQRSDLERIQRSQRHLLGLINGVLNYAKVEAGAVHYVLADVALDEVLATCEALTAPQVRARGLTFRSEGCDRALRVRADREKLQQVVLNLLSNAVKFTAPGGHVALRCMAEAGGAGATVHVQVADTGIGIAADQLARVFEPFVQVDAGFTREGEGVGLGLSISRDLARGMGGDLSAESTPGAGSTFTLTLPRA